MGESGGERVRGEVKITVTQTHRQGAVNSGGQCQRGRQGRGGEWFTV